MGDTYLVAFVDPYGSAEQITNDWREVVEENRPHLDNDTRIRVWDSDGKRVYYERVSYDG